MEYSVHCGSINFLVLGNAYELGPSVWGGIGVILGIVIYHIYLEYNGVGTVTVVAMQDPGGTIGTSCLRYFTVALADQNVASELPK